MTDLDERTKMYEALIHKVAADYHPFPLMIDDRFIRVVAMALGQLDGRVEKLETDSKAKGDELAVLRKQVAEIRQRGAVYR